jgi:bifunctional non-homologous end joining protein LigD
VFDVLHLDGQWTHPLPYAERRALLEELALDGPAWRTPATISIDRRVDFIACVEELGLEGVVAKRLRASLPSASARHISPGADARRG